MPMPQRMQDATSSAPPTSNRERFQELDGLRGIAAVAVVWSHLTGNFDSKHPDAPAPFADIWWGVYGVQLFFLISGFVILMTAQRAQRPSDFVISRVSRLYPVYWIALTVSIIVSIAFAVPHTDVGWTARIMNYTMIQRLLLFDNVDEVYWTLAIEMQFYMLIFVLLLLTRCRLTDRRALLLAVVWGAFSLVLAVVLGGHTRGVDPRFVVAPVKMALNLLLVEWGPLFAAGMLAFLARHDRRRAPWAIGGAAAAVAVSGILHGWLQALCVAVVAVLFLAVALRPRTAILRWAPVQFYGRISYSLYIGHCVTGTAMLHALIPYTGRNLGMVLVFIAVTGIAVVYHRVGEVGLSRRFRTLLLAVRTRIDNRRRRPHET